MESGLVLAEQRVLAYAIKHHEYIPSLRADMFVSSTAKMLMHGIKALPGKAPITPENLLVEVAGGAVSVSDKDVHSLFTVVVDDLDVDYLVSALRKASKQKKLQNDVAPVLLDTITSKSGVDYDKLKKAIQQASDLINQEDVSHCNIDGANIGSFYEETLTERQSGAYFFGSGDSYLDKTITLGFAPGTMTTLFGTTGSGKTNFALSLLLKQIHKMIPSLYVSLEMPAEMLIDRLFANKYKIPITNLYPHMTEEGRIESWVFDDLQSFKNEMKDCKYFRIVDRPNLSIDELESLIVETKQSMGVDYLNVIVDLASMLADFTDVGRNTHSFAIQVAMNRLNSLVKKHGVHMLNLTQSNREQDNVKISKISDIDKLFPTLNNIRDGNTIAERSRLVLAVFRPKYYADRYLPDDPETAIMEDIMYVCNLKQSQGAVQRLKYLFMGETASIYKYDNELKSIEVATATNNGGSNVRPSKQDRVEEDVGTHEKGEC